MSKNNVINLWDLLDKYDGEDFPTWDESMLHKDEVQIPTEIAITSSPLQNLHRVFKPHSNPLKENYKKVKAEYLQDSKGNYLLYPGHVHLLYGKPGTWKSWIALSLIGKHDVRYWDFENFGPIIASRLHSLGVDPKDSGVFAYPESRAQIFELVDEYLFTKPEILVVDGMSGISRTLGINSDANDQVEKLFNDVFMRLKRAGICVLILDHLPKDSLVDDFPIGAQAKKSQCDVAILMKPRRDSDEVDVYVSKDRNHDLFSRCETGPTPRFYGRLLKITQDEKLRVSIEPDLIALINGKEIDSFDANLFQEVWNFIRHAPDSSGTKIEENVSGKNSRIRHAIEWLTLNQFLVQKRKGNGFYYQIDKALKDAIQWHSRGDYFPLN